MPTDRPPPSDPAEDVLGVQQTTCCVVGGGAGGLVLALLLARRGVPVTLLEGVNVGGILLGYLAVLVWGGARPSSRSVA